jgi:Domain of unknown function (DUF4376)
MKTVYLYDENGLFTGTYDAQESPLELGVYITPDLSTDIEPSHSDKTWPKFVGGAWSSIADNRGMVWDTVTCVEVEHNELGNLPENLTAITKPDGYYKWSGTKWVLDLSKAQAAQITKIEASYQSAIQTDIDYLGATFNADNSTQLLLVKVLSAGQIPDGFFWQDISNNQIPMTYAQAQGFSSAILERGQLAFVKLQSLKTAIRAAVDVNAVALIVW